MSKKSEKFHNRNGEFEECSSCVTCHIRLDDTCTVMDDADYCPNYISWRVCRACVLDSLYDDVDDLDSDDCPLEDRLDDRSFVDDDYLPF